jgi:hypothetical protein
LRDRVRVAQDAPVLRCSKLHELAIAPGQLAWPWVAFTPERSAFAFPASERSIALHGATSPGEQRLVQLPEALRVPEVGRSPEGTTSRQPGLHAIALHPDGRTVVGFGWHKDIPVACVERVGGAPELVDLGPALGDLGPLAATFTRDGESIWVSAESASAAALVRLRFRDFSLESKAAFEPAPPPASHELHLHPVEDAVLLTMACGQDGTFLRVARSAGAKLELVPTQGDGGIEPCGFAETTEDGALVCLVTFDRVELRRWPGMEREANLDVDDALEANYNGVRMGGRFVVSATEHEDGEDERALVLSDSLKLEDDAPGPPGMWAGRLGLDKLVTVSRNADEPRRVFVYSLEV